jgi:PAS domain S-box-containing protein
MAAIIDTATDGIITIDDKGIIEMANTAAAKLFEYNSEEMVGNNISMLMPNPYSREHDGYIRNYLTTGVAKIIGIGREVTGQKKNGSTFPMRLSISEVNLRDRRLFTGIVHDLSEQKAAEESIQKLNSELENRVEERTEELANAVNKLLDINRQLEKEVLVRKKAEDALRENEAEIIKALEKEKELNQLKSRFVSMASHEFRTPLSTILSSADLIEAYTKAEQNAKRLKHTTRIKSSVSNLTGILNDFLSLSKLEEGIISVEKTEFEINAFCESVLEELQGALKPNQKILHNTMEEKYTVKLDKKLLRNILFNLFSNASKYSADGKSIHCSTVVEDQHLKIMVRDEGIGIPKEDQVHLFSRFFRAHNVENIQGTGLGLNIVKRYVDLLNGEISFESEEGKGTTFFIEIPI